ncbi:MAG: HtaA domain-containing protein [Propionicimonas sp.]|uniref:HtaA domain-containing protein n=1 Tax=Propionicimonas sp. TaxID=1955623 RepID=UPI003D0B1E01
MQVKRGLRRALRGAAAGFAMLLLVAVTTMPGATARAAGEAAEVTGGTLTWGVKSSFWSYITGPIAHGTVEAGGAASLDGNQARFADGSGTWADDGGTLSTRGSVRFTGHDGELDLTIANPRLVADGDDGTLVVDVTDSEGGTSDDLAIADVDLSGAVTIDGDTVVVSGAKATLTKAGTAVFAYHGTPMYAAGTALADLSARFTIAVAEPTATPTSTPTDEPTSTATPTVTATPTATTTSTGTPTATSSPTATSTATASGKAGSLTWGVKSSFRSYITGPIAHGSISVARGAKAVGGGYRFGQSATSADPPDAAGTTTYRGTVRFTGHDGVLDLSFTDPAITVTSSGSARLSASVTGHGRVVLANLSLSSGSRGTASGSVTYTGVDATLTAAGAKVFSYHGSAFYPAGTALDPVTFVVGTKAAASNSSGTVATASTASASATATATASATTGTAAATLGCRLSDAELVWGFKESFRAYISGTIANGDWTTGGGATYATPVFTWHAGAGSGDAEAGTGEIAFSGTVRFTGHDGALDTTIADPVVAFTGPGAAVLRLDYAGTTMDAALAGKDARQETPDVPFVQLAVGEGTLTRAGDRVTISDIPASLTGEGSAAFPNYQAGSAFDPVTLSYTATDCATAATPSPAGQSSAVAPGATGSPAAAGTDGGVPDWVGWVASGTVGAVLGSALTLLVARRWLVRA